MKPTRPLIQCTKFLFLLFNFVFWLTGVGLLGIGIWSKISLFEYMKLSTSINYTLAPYIMIGCGCFVLLIGFLGCWAAIKEHAWALILYMVILIILFIAELAAGVAGYVLRGKLKAGLRHGLENGLKKYKNDTSGATKNSVDKIQSKGFKCCGIDSFQDWYTYGGYSNGTLPGSCCKTAGKKTCHPGKDLYYKDGCISAMEKFFKKNFAIIGGVALGIAVFQLFGIICAYLMAKFIRVVSSYEQM